MCVQTSRGEVLHMGNEQQAVAGEYYWPLFTGDMTDTPVGALLLFSCRDAQGREIPDHKEVGFEVHSDACGQGFGTALVRAGLCAMFTRLDLATMRYRVRPDNRASLAVKNRTGFYEAPAGPEPEWLYFEQINPYDPHWSRELAQPHRGEPLHTPDALAGFRARTEQLLATTAVHFCAEVGCDRALANKGSV